MVLRVVFILLMSSALRSVYSLDLSCIIAIVLWKRGFRSFWHDVFVLSLSGCLLAAAHWYEDWHYWWRPHWPIPLDGGVSKLNTWLHYGMIHRSTGSLRAFLEAVLVGDKSFLSTESSERFRALGISHMLAVSGFHIGLWTALFAPFQRVLRARGFQWVLWIAFCGFFTVYAALVGAGASVVRAVATFLIAYFIRLLYRRVDAFHVPFLVGIGSYLYDPKWPATLGFQLSYTAVFAILWALRGTSASAYIVDFTLEKSGGKSRGKFLWVPVQISLAAWSATLPIVQYHFGGASPYFLIGNLLIVPVYTFYVWSAFVVKGLGCFMPFWLLRLWSRSFEQWELWLDQILMLLKP
jgi:ComEC/Rec2-related protein